jgi:HD-like signal output (HDOD) protein
LAQRYLTKPCAVDDLDEAISRDSGLIKAFDNPVVQELAGSAGCLPTSETAQQQCLLTSMIARDIAPTADRASVAMRAGLLHDVGKIIIVLQKPELIKSLVNVLFGSPYDWVDTVTEREIISCTYAEVRGYFLNLWGIPTSVVEAVFFHDDPAAVSAREFDAIGVVHVSNYLAHWGASKEGSDSIEKSSTASIWKTLT